VDTLGWPALLLRGVPGGRSGGTANFDTFIGGDCVVTRIDPSTIPDEFRATGVKPVRHGGTFLRIVDGKPCGCIIGEKLAAALGPARASENFAAMEILELTLGSLDYQAGLSDGWEDDDDTSGHYCDFESIDYIDGVEDGLNAWNACVAVGLCRS
jgi:hypothetical protein